MLDMSLEQCRKRIRALVIQNTALKKKLQEMQKMLQEFILKKKQKEL